MIGIPCKLCRNGVVSCVDLRIIFVSNTDTLWQTDNRYIVFRCVVVESCIGKANATHIIISFEYFQLDCFTYRRIIVIRCICRCFHPINTCVFGSGTQSASLNTIDIFVIDIFYLGSRRVFNDRRRKNISVGNAVTLNRQDAVGFGYHNIHTTAFCDISRQSYVVVNFFYSRLGQCRSDCRSVSYVVVSVQNIFGIVNNCARCSRRNAYGVRLSVINTLISLCNTLYFGNFHKACVVNQVFSKKTRVISRTNKSRNGYFRQVAAVKQETVFCPFGTDICNLYILNVCKGFCAVGISVTDIHRNVFAARTVFFSVE